MILPLHSLALGAAIVLSNAPPLVAALNARDIPVDTPVSQLISSATAALAQGNPQDALAYFDVAITRDPQNYLTIFRRGAAYLQLGKTSQASHDFDRVLAIKPTFEGALVQRAKIKSRNGDWAGAKADYDTAGKKHDDAVRDLLEAQNAASLSQDAEKQGRWSDCTAQADVAGGAMDLRHRRAKCRFEKGDVVEALSDLLHVAQVSSGSTEHLQISTTSFFALNEPESAMSQVKKCLHSDPDSKPCRKVLKAEKAIDKQLKKLRQYMEKNKFVNAVNMLVPTKDDEGLLKAVKDATQQYRDEGLIHKNAPDRLYNDLIELTCEAYIGMNNHKKAQPYCEEALSHNPTCLPALISKATRQLDADEFEPAIHTLNQAKEHHQNSQKVQEMLQNAHTLLKRSKQKDYYKVLGVTRDAEEREIKKAYRKLTIQHHPDKAAQKGINADEAQKKMAEINEAYEVLSDAELRERFDRGDDPNDNSQQGNPFQGQPFGFPGGGGGQQQFFHQRGGGGAHFKFQHQGFGGFPF
jgi:DnaJ family protein C protein 3